MGEDFSARTPRDERSVPSNMIDVVATLREIARRVQTECGMNGDADPRWKDGEAIERAADVLASQRAVLQFAKDKIDAARRLMGIEPDEVDDELYERIVAALAEQTEAPASRGEADPSSHP